MSNDEAEKAAREWITSRGIVDTFREVHNAFLAGVAHNAPHLRAMADCVLMLDSYLANDGQMDDELVQRALKLADIYRTL